MAGQDTVMEVELFTGPRGETREDVRTIYHEDMENFGDDLGDKINRFIGGDYGRVELDYNTLREHEFKETPEDPRNTLIFIKGFTSEEKRKLVGKKLRINVPNQGNWSIWEGAVNEDGPFYVRVVEQQLPELRRRGRAVRGLAEASKTYGFGDEGKYLPGGITSNIASFLTGERSTAGSPQEQMKRLKDKRPGGRRKTRRSANKKRRSLKRV
jgi:hypothetical protein